VADDRLEGIGSGVIARLPAEDRDERPATSPEILGEAVGDGRRFGIGIGPASGAQRAGDA
jgi:hypothetical protein